MWISTIKRDDLIAMVQGESLRNQPLRRFEAFEELERFSSGLVAVWENKPDDSSLPNLLCMPEKEKRDFFAWANSFVKIKPLTAFVRTLDFETLEKLTTPPPNNGRWEQGLIGLILAEALTHLDQPASKLSLRACEGTYSFASARSALHVQGPRGVSQTGLNWFRSREALGNQASKLALTQLQQVWSVVTKLVSSESADDKGSETVTQCCRDLVELGDITDADWRTLTRDLPVYDLRAVMKNTREERVIVLEDFLRSLGSDARERGDISFLAGYLVSMVAPGTLDHWRLLNPIKQSLPTVGLWYGLCAGLLPESRLDSYGGGVGRLITRELRRKVHLLEQPTCDIAVDELDVTGPFFKAERMVIGTSIEVEIAPGISVPFRSNGADQPRSELYLEPPSRFNESSLDLKLLDNLDDAYEALDALRRNIQKNMPNSGRSYLHKPRKKRP